MKIQKNQLTKRLQSLYEQKLAIEEQIAKLEKQLQLAPNSFSKEQKIALFRSLFINRSDIYLKKWVAKEGGKQNYYPVTQTFQGKDYIPLTDYDIEQHLRGKVQLASYMLNTSNQVNSTVIHLDESDALKLLNECLKQQINPYFYRSSKNELLAWLFFKEATPAKKAKALGVKLIQNASINAQVFPFNEFVNASSLGSFMELPLHLEQRNENRTLFLNNSLKPHKDQWEVLSSVVKIDSKLVDKISSKAVEQPQTLQAFEEIVYPNFELKMIIYDYLYIPTVNLSESFLIKLKELASFDNPQVQTLLKLRKPLYNTPRVIRSYEEDENYLKLPRGLIEEVKNILKQNSVKYTVESKRLNIKTQFKELTFTLRPEQQEAIDNILKTDYSICVAPPGFGKTLIGAKMIEERGVNTLVLVNKNMLLDQWIERFVNYFGYTKKEIGFLGKGKNKLNGELDVATMQSLKNNPDLILDYSFVIVDECHHIPAVTFEQIVKQFHGEYILGLSATPNRKDGLQPILYQQLGEIAYEHKKKRVMTHRLKLVDTLFDSTSDNFTTIINELCQDQRRNELILDEIKAVQDRKTLVLTDRIEHINLLEELLQREGIRYLSIHGSLNKKEQVERMSQVESHTLLLATTSFFGEGIDFPHLNTIIFATPISYYGRLVQYLGRIGRDGQECLAIDLLDSKHGMLYSAYKKRLEGYKQMHYSARKG